MAAAHCLLSEDELMCCICLELLTDPVSTPCGHNFCRDCITKHWDMCGRCSCPLCKEKFHIRPELKINTFISGIVAQFRQRATQNLRNQTCSRHNKPLELFCETDQTCVCVHCSVLQHKNHQLVPLKEGCEAKQAELKKTEAKTAGMIEERRQKIREIRESLELSQRAADEEAAEGLQVFSALMECVQKGLDEVLQEIQDKQTKAKKKAEDLIKALEREISDLTQRSSEVQQLTCSEDHLHVLKTAPCLKPAPTKDWTKVKVSPLSFLGTVQRTVSQLEKEIAMKMQLFTKSQLQKVQQSTQDMTLDPDKAHSEPSVSQKLFSLKTAPCPPRPTPNKVWTKVKVSPSSQGTVTATKPLLFAKALLQKVQRSAVNVTLDPDTAHSELSLSQDLKQVSHTGLKKKLPNSSKRITGFYGVLGKDSFSSGRFYFEVQVKGNYDWIVGVAKESINRKTPIIAAPPNGFWTIWIIKENEYGTANPECVPLLLKSQLHRVGVFVDYDEGLVSFYDADTAACIHSFTGCNFTEKLYPYFFTQSVKDQISAPLILAPVRTRE